MKNVQFQKINRGKISVKQLRANATNSKSGGVKTPTGKEISKYNAVKHGILRLSISEYEEDFYENCLSDLTSELKPEGYFEITLVERIALCQLRLFRVSKAEGESMKENLSSPLTRLEKENLMLTIHRLYNAPEKYKPQISTENISQMLSSLIRYETAIENKMYKALHELQRLQDKRFGREYSTPTAIDIIGDKEDE